MDVGRFKRGAPTAVGGEETSAGEINGRVRCGGVVISNVICSAGLFWVRTAVALRQVWQALLTNIVCQPVGNKLTYPPIHFILFSFTPTV